MENQSIDDIVGNIRKRLANSEQATDLGVGVCKPNPPTTSMKIHRAEEQLGFELPLLLKRLYVWVANGGFGPGYGLAGIDGCGADEGNNDIVALYQGQMSAYWQQEFPRWPPQVLRIAYLGCAMHCAVDCATPEYPMYLFDPNSDQNKNCLIPYECSLNDWLGAWAQGKDVQFPPGMMDEDID